MPKQRKSKTVAKREAGRLVESRPVPVAYEVYLSEAAERAYSNFYEKAEKARQRGDVSNSHVTTLNMIDEVLERIIPADPFNKRYALTGKLSKIFRMQKGRLRICWIGSSEYKRICVIFISETLRKAGDVNDPYRLLTNMVLSGEFNAIFQELGIPSPSSVGRKSFMTQ